MIDLSGGASARRRVLLYSNDTHGNGHLRQSLLLAGRLVSMPEVGAVMVTAASPEPIELHRATGVDVVTLPAVVEDGATYRSQAGGVPLEELLRFRGNVLGTVVDSYRPDLIVVDDLPVGFEAELWPVLRRFVQTRSRPRLVLGLRDVVDGADRVSDEWARLDAWRVVDRLYDRVLVYGDESLTTTATELRLTSRLKARVRHVGYLAPPTSPVDGAHAPDPMAPPTVLLVTGHDAASAPLIAAYAEFVSSLPPTVSFRCVEAAEAHRGTGDAICHAAAVIATGDYGTVSSVLAASVPTLLVPRPGPSQEQALRTARLAPTGMVEVVAAGDISADHLRRFVADALDCGRALDRDGTLGVFAPTATPTATDGLDRVAAEVGALLAQPATFGPAPAIEPPAAVRISPRGHMSPVAGQPVGYVLRQFPSPAETPILDELIGLESAGIPVRLLSLGAPDENQPRAARLERLTAPVTVIGASSGSSLRSLFDELDRRAGPDGARQARSLLHRLPGPTGVQILDHALQVADRVRTEGLAHLHTHHMDEAAYTTYVAHLVTDVPFSVTVHGGDVFRHNVDREAFSEVAAAATTVITQCEASRRHVLDELMLDRDARVEVVPPGVAVDTPGADAGRIGGFVVGVGHLHERKGFDVLVGACDRLLGQGVDIGCAIVGDGPERDHLATLIRAADIGDRVRLAGALPYEQVRELMRKATVVAAPAVTTGDGDRDALPLVLLEAMASGTPVVSTPVGGIPELIDDGVDGILVPSRDRAGLAAGLQLLVQEPDTWARLSDAAVGKIRRQFDPSTTAQRLAGVLGRGATVAINLTQ